MKKIAILCALVALLVLAGCTTITPVGATGNPVGSKVGEATGSFLLGIIPLGTADMGIHTATKLGGISTVSTVDVKVVDYLLFTKVSTIVTGE